MVCHCYTLLTYLGLTFPQPYRPYVTAKALPKVLPVAPHPTAYPKALPSVKPHPVTAYPRHHSPAALPHAPVPTGPYNPRPTPPTAVAHSLPFKHHPKAAATPLYHHSPKPTPVYHLSPKPTPVYHHPEPKKPILPAPPQPVKPVLLPKPVAPHPKPVVPHPEPHHHPDPYLYVSENYFQSGKTQPVLPCNISLFHGTTTLNSFHCA